MRYGTQLWDIGYPDRTGDKFFKGDGANYWLWGWNLRYALLFPNDLTYTIGKSDYHKDWFFEEVPHATDLSFVNPAAKDPANQRFGWVKAESLDAIPANQHRAAPGASTAAAARRPGPSNSTWTKPAQGYAAFRVALAGADGNGGLAVGRQWPERRHASGPSPTNAIRYNTDKGLWQERTADLRRRAAEAGRK